MSLMLKRRPGQTVHLDLGDGREVVVTVARDCSPNGKGQLKLLFDAPASVKIVRGEILDSSERR